MAWLLSVGERWSSLGDKAKEVQGKKYPFLEESLLDLGTILMWSLSYAFHEISKKLLWYSVRALGRCAAKTMICNTACKYILLVLAVLG